MALGVDGRVCNKTVEALHVGILRNAGHAGKRSEMIALGSAVIRQAIGKFADIVSEHQGGGGFLGDKILLRNNGNEPQDGKYPCIVVTVWYEPPLN